MKLKNIFLIGACMLLAGNPLTSVSANEAQQSTAQDPDQTIKCRKVEVTGSLLKKGRVCRTIAEWKQIQENGNRTARAIGDSGKICAGGLCGNGN